MDFSKLLSKITLLEAITMADIKAAVGQEKDEQKRAAILNDIAWKENLPGLYDPVSGYFVRKQSMPNSRNGGEGGYSIAATAREADTQMLAKLGLVPTGASTSALGGLVGVGSFSNSAEQNAAAGKAVIDQSNKFNADATSKQVNGANLAKLNDLVAKLTGKPTASAQIGADAAAYDAAKASTKKVNQGAQKAPAAKMPADARGWDSQVQESLQRKMSALLNEEFGIGERVVGGEETPPGINRLTGKPIEPQAAPVAAPADEPAVVPLSKRFDPRFKNGPEPYTIDIGGVVYKFAGRDKAAPGGGEVIKVPAAVVGIRGLGAVSVELGKDGMYYAAPQQESVAESMSSLRSLLAELEEGAVGKYVGREAGEIAARDAAAAEVKALGNSAKAPYQMKGGAADISDAQIKDPAMRAKAMQWMKDNPGTSIGAAAAAVGATVVGLDASGRKNASTDPRVASNAPNTASQSDVRKVDNAIAAKAGVPAQAAQAAKTATGQTSATGQTGATSWRQIYDMNKDVIGSNPNLIKPGQKLKMPDGSTYTVNPGDNLSKIAKGAKGGTPAAATDVGRVPGAAHAGQGGTTPATGEKPGEKPDDKKGAAHAGQGGTVPATVEKPADVAPAVAGPTPEQAELIKQIQAVMMDLAQTGESDPAVAKALSNAQSAIDSVGKAPATPVSTDSPFPAGGRFRNGP